MRRFMKECDRGHLQDAIFKFLRGMKGFREDSRRLVETEFGWDKIVLGIENVYNEVVL